MAEATKHTTSKPAKSAKKAASAKKSGKAQPADKVKAEVLRAQNGSPGIRISINIDLQDGSDPEFRDLVMKLLKKQLEL